MPILKKIAAIEHRVEALRLAHKESGLDRAEQDISGGIASATR